MTVPDQGAGEEAEAAEGSVSEQAATKQPPKKRPPKKTVEQNLSNINLSESEMKCEVKDVAVSPVHQILHSLCTLGHTHFTVLCMMETEATSTLMYMHLLLYMMGTEAMPALQGLKD